MSEFHSPSSCVPIDVKMWRIKSKEELEREELRKELKVWDKLSADEIEEQFNMFIHLKND